MDRKEQKDAAKNGSMAALERRSAVGQYLVVTFPGLSSIEM